MCIKDTPKVDRSREITKQCAICGKGFSVKIFPDGKYFGGNYFGKMATDQKDTLEYWECDGCYN